MPVAAHPASDLSDDVEDRAACDCVKGEFQRFRGDAVAEHRAEEGRRPTDQADQPEPAPGGPYVPERPDDAESLGGVMEGEDDDQHGGEADVSCAGRYADGKALGEVV